MNPLQQIREGGMKPVNRQTARMLGDSLSETLSLAPAKRRKAEQEMRVKRGMLSLDGHHYRRWWNLEKFAAANDLELGARGTVDAFLKILKAARKVWPDTKGAGGGSGKG